MSSTIHRSVLLRAWRPRQCAGPTLPPASIIAAKSAVRCATSGSGKGTPTHAHTARHSISCTSSKRTMRSRLSQLAMQMSLAVQALHAADAEQGLLHAHGCRALADETICIVKESGGLSAAHADRVLQEQSRFEHVAVITPAAIGDVEITLSQQGERVKEAGVAREVHFVAPIELPLSKCSRACETGLSRGAIV